MLWSPGGVCHLDRRGRKPVRDMLFGVIYTYTYVRTHMCAHTHVQARGISLSLTHKHTLAESPIRKKAHKRTLANMHKRPAAGPPTGLRRAGQGVGVERQRRHAPHGAAAVAAEPAKPAGFQKGGMAPTCVPPPLE